MITNEFVNLISKIPLISIYLLWLAIGYIYFDRTTKYQFKNQLVVKDNPAFGVLIAGYMVGYSISLLGALAPCGGDLLADIGGFSLRAFFNMVALRTSVKIADVVILRFFKVHKEIIEDRNVGTALAVAAICIATGFVIRGAWLGQSPSKIAGVIDFWVYWLEGQAMFLIAAEIWQRITPYDFHEEIARDYWIGPDGSIQLTDSGQQGLRKVGGSIAAGILFAGYIIGIGLLVGNSISGASHNIPTETFISIFRTSAGLVAMILAQAVLAYRFGDQHSILEVQTEMSAKATILHFVQAKALIREIVEQKNPAVASLAAGIFICIAGGISQILQIMVVR